MTAKNEILGQIDTALSLGNAKVRGMLGGVQEFMTRAAAHPLAADGGPRDHEAAVAEAER